MHHTERSVMKRSLKLQSLGKTNAVMTFACHLSYDWSDALCIICVIISVLPCTWQRWPWWNRFSGEILSWLTMRSNIWLSPTFHLFKVKKKNPLPILKKLVLFFFSFTPWQCLKQCFQHVPIFNPLPSASWPVGNFMKNKENLFFFLALGSCKNHR